MSNTIPKNCICNYYHTGSKGWLQRIFKVDCPVHTKL